ncbi:uncharacterized protein LOC128449027 [Pleuronectes platessa]|uniref:uncharacterized protein LOC128449027 n=1 Tax=Pleuronectes platessa TaxID=8262 RepID=UPI00232A6BA5|nr:uncharacterized protein LOC128449027 [Pleuronectes platessa]XP_053287960.1 uncharacterized protein LOC128449027 [Pleuronectes platessa]XP_053287961.1 uncharacterized protein LOC128449027 [Pleuronectes platessa]
MAALRVFLPFAICLLLGHQTFAQNDAPCQKSKWNNAFNTFKYRHILNKLPNSLQKEKWNELIKKDNNCSRTRQSFLGLDMLDKVKAVCTKEGGKIYEKNMCISNQIFTFYTVIIQEVTCKILKVCWVMAALRVFLPLAICLLLGHQTFAQNDAPCQKSKRNNEFNTFEERHISDELPSADDLNKWKEYIKNKGNCKRPIQSFLLRKDLDKVKAVCRDAGKKMYNNNLCISNQPFTFFTVTSEIGTCNIWSVSKENKSLILGCNTLADECLPVHFERNPQNRGPHKCAESCQAP